MNGYERLDESKQKQLLDQIEHTDFELINSLYNNTKKEIEFKDILKIMWKEFRVAILTGITLAAANFIKLLVIDKVNMSIASVVCLTLIITIIFAKIVGCTLPLLAKKVGFDPAVMASPFITTIVDALSLITYFQIATILLGL